VKILRGSERSSRSGALRHPVTEAGREDDDSVCPRLFLRRRRRFV
jgi:hypothetical protein